MKNNKAYWILTVGMCVVLVIALMLSCGVIHRTVKVDEPVEVVNEVVENEEVLDDGVLILEDTPSEAPELPESNKKKLKKKNTPVVKSTPVEESVASDKPVMNEEPVIDDGNAKNRRIFG